MMKSTDIAANACKLLIKLSQNVDTQSKKCEEGVASLTSNSDTVIEVVEQTKAGVKELNDSISIFKTR
jgi:hypothetical protein